MAEAQTGKGLATEIQTIELNNDLRDWLDYTGWNNVTYRADKLAYDRTLRVVELQRTNLRVEESKLQKFEKKYGGKKYSRACLNAHDSVTDSVHGVYDYVCNDELPLPAPLPQHNTTVCYNNNKDWDLAAEDQDIQSDPFIDHMPAAYNGNDIDSMGHSVDHDSDYRSPARESSLYPSPRSGGQIGAIEIHESIHNRSRSRSPTTSRKPEWPRAKQTVGQATTLFTERREYRDNRSGGFDPIGLGEKGDTRFFVIRSYSIENVQDAMEDGLWASKHENAKKLSDAFESCKKVILIFGANETGEFQGYARMTGTPSPENPKPKWWAAIKWPVSEPFTIEWISKTAISGRLCRGLKNRLNEDLPVTRSRDCQELDDYCGRGMVATMNREAMKA